MLQAPVYSKDRERSRKQMFHWMANKMLANHKAYHEASFCHLMCLLIVQEKCEKSQTGDPIFGGRARNITKSCAAFFCENATTQSLSFLQWWAIQNFPQFSPESILCFKREPFGRWSSLHDNSNEIREDKLADFHLLCNRKAVPHHT